MTLFSGIAGFSARGSQVFEKVEEDMSNLIEKRMENYISRGQARWEAHKAEKKLKRQISRYKFLRTKNTTKKINS